MGTSYLIVNADDFGQSAGINRGIIQAHENGIVTSASLMVRWPAARAAADYARARSSLGLGLHLDFGEWCCRDEVWEPLYEVVDTTDEAAVRTEALNQLAVFHSLTGKNPTHIDSHQHTHLKEPARAVVAAMANELGCPLRSCDSEITYVGNFYGQTSDGVALPELISVAGLINILRGLPSGICELSCHPGFADDLKTMYQRERADEVEVICDPRIKTTITELGIELITFAELPVRV